MKSAVKPKKSPAKAKAKKLRANAGRPAKAPKRLAKEKPVAKVQPAAKEKPAAKVQKATSLRVTRVEADLDLVAPDDCSASVLLKHVTSETSPQGAGSAVFVYWMLAGRYGLRAATAGYRHQSGGLTLRVDVPRGVALTSAYLLEQALAYWKESGDVNLPPDTPVIKG